MILLVKKFNKMFASILALFVLPRIAIKSHFYALRKAHIPHFLDKFFRVRHMQDMAVLASCITV